MHIILCKTRSFSCQRLPTEKTWSTQTIKSKASKSSHLRDTREILPNFEYKQKSSRFKKEKNFQKDKTHKLDEISLTN